MRKQLNMDQFLGDKIESYREARLACALLLDVSGSMGGQAIESLNNGIRRFKDQVVSDLIDRQRVDLALITFGSEVNVISDFVPISEMPTPVFQAEGRAEMAKGIQTAIDMVKRRTQMYMNLGTPCHKPWIFMITKGETTSSSQEMADAAERIRFEESQGAHGHLSFWAFGTEKYNSEQLFLLTNRVMELKDQDFIGIFDWLGGNSTMNSFDYQELGPLPNYARKAEKDRRIDEGWY